MTRWRGPLVITGTDTGVGKTVVAAGIAAAAARCGQRVAVLKPAQTGDDDDAGTVARLGSPATVTCLTRYPDPLAPLTAANTSGLPPLAMRRVIDAVAELTRSHDLVLVEGAGGLLVPMGLASGQAWTVADLAVALGAPAVIVVRASLGTLNHTALTVEALHRRGVPTSLVIGSWPRRPELVHRSNLTDLARIAELVGRVPEGSGQLTPERFRRQAPGWFENDRVGGVPAGQRVSG